MIPLTTKRTFLVVLFLGLFTMAARNVEDPDIWWHLRTGEYIVAHRSVPHTDPFSYTRFGQPWVAHEWLTEVGLYELEHAAGFAGLILTFAAILTAAFVALYFRCGPAAYIAGAITLCGAIATRPVWGVRPQVVSLLLFSLWLLILEQGEKNPRILWWTVPLTLLWVNLHAGFALGIAVLAIYLLGTFTELLFHRSQSASHWRPATIVFTIDVLMVPLNPNGLRMFSYPFETLRSAAMQNYIAEWASPNFHRAEYWPLLLLILATLVTLAASRVPLRIRNLLLLIVSLCASLNAIRMIPFFVLISCPVISRRVPAWPRANSNPSQPRLHGAINAAIILAIVFFAVVHTDHVIGRQPLIESQVFPSRAVAFLNAHPPQGRIFNHYDWGGYLIWKLPSVPVFIDGRADLYGEQLFLEFQHANEFKDDWRQVLQRWQVKTVIVPPNSALAVGLQADHGWSIVYGDSQATIFRASPQEP